MKISVVISLVAFFLLFDWKSIPTLWFRIFLMGKKHVDYYTRFDWFIYNTVYKREKYDLTKIISRNLVISLLVLLSILLSLVE